MTFLNLVLALIVGVLLIILFCKFVGFLVAKALWVIGPALGLILNLVFWPFKAVFKLLFGWALH